MKSEKAEKLTEVSSTTKKDTPLSSDSGTSSKPLNAAASKATGSGLNYSKWDRIDDYDDDEDLLNEQSAKHPRVNTSIPSKQQQRIQPQKQLSVNEFKWNGDTFVIASWDGGRDDTGHAHGTGYLTSINKDYSNKIASNFECALHHGVVRGCFLMSRKIAYMASTCNDDGLLDGMHLLFPPTADSGLFQISGV